MFKRSLLILVFFSGIQYSCSSSTKKEEEKMAAQKEVAPVAQEQGKKILPNMRLVGLDAKQFNAQSLKGKRTVLILFQPDCEHCQNESKQIAERLDKFAKYELYFVSTAAIPEIQKFSVDYKLAGKPNIHFAKTEVQQIIDSFGPIPAPSIFIYSENGEQLNSFQGEMEMDVIIKYLQ
jgi:thioredoxin-related protein